MSDISVQFYASVEELTAWLTEWLSIDEITLVSLTFEPFSVATLQRDEVAACVHNPCVQRVCMFAKKPLLDVSSKSEFESRNADELVLDIGRQTEDGLAESWLACRSHNRDVMATWRRIAKDVKAKTLRGATAINRSNGVSAFYPTIRYSTGAKTLEERGIPMLPVQGVSGPIIRLGLAGHQEPTC